jgi:hypothetical protein
MPYPTPDDALGATSGTVDGEIHTRFGVFDHHIAHTHRHHPQMAALFCSAGRAIVVAEPHDDPLNLFVRLNLFAVDGQRKAQPPLRMEAQSIGHWKMGRLDVYLHWVPAFATLLLCHEQAC